MGRVDHQPGLAPLLEGDEPGKIAEIAVHAVEAFGDDQDALVAIAARFEHRIERGEIVVRERSALRARQMRAADDAVVGERVVNNEVARADQGADRRHVRRVPADEGQAGVLPVVPGERRLERPMHRPFAGHEPARRRRDAVAVDRLAGRAPDGRMTIESEIVVGRKIEHAAAVDDGESAGVALVHQEERVPQPHGRRGRLQQPLLRVARQILEIEPACMVRAGRFRPLAGIGRRRRSAEALPDQRVEEAPVGVSQAAGVLFHQLQPRGRRGRPRRLSGFQRRNRVGLALSDPLLATTGGTTQDGAPPGRGASLIVATAGRSLLRGRLGNGFLGQWRSAQQFAWG